MQVIQSPEDIYRLSKTFSKSGKSVGLVPTMGALHDGHLSLVQESVGHNEVTIVSIFVNPMQFNNAEDLKSYPRDLEKDLKMLEHAGVDCVFCPSEAEMYPNQPVTSVGFGTLSTKMEGRYRPGHFNGVGVVVSKLFHMSQPQKAYFGLKDLQQFLLIKKMVEDLSFPVEIVGVPIKREASGLAMSSRNERLSGQGKEIAIYINKGLDVAKSCWEKELSISETKKEVNDFYSKVTGLEIEYFEVVDPQTLEEISENTFQPVAFCFAGYVEGVRLIDNLYLRQD